MRDKERDCEERENFLRLFLVTTKKLTKQFKEDSGYLGSQLVDHGSFEAAIKL